MIPEGYLGTLWELWHSKVIEPAHIIKALSLHGYELTALTNGGIVTSNKNTRFEYKKYINRS